MAGEVVTRDGSLADRIYRQVSGLAVGESVRIADPAGKSAVRVSLHFLGKRAGKRWAVNQREPGLHDVTRKE